MLKHKTDYCSLYHCDVFDGLNYIDDESVDLIIADPPFNLNKDFDVFMSSTEYIQWCDDWIQKCWKKVKPNGSFFLMTIQDHIGAMMNSLSSKGFFRNQIVWFNSSLPVKDRFCIGYQPILWYVKNLENYTFNYGAEKSVSKTRSLPWGKKSNVFSLKDIWDDIPFISGGCMASKEALFVGDGSRKKKHSAQMPINLASRMIKHCSNEGDTVLDPFSGSGTTLISCKLLNRKSIGIERNEEYCSLIIDRLNGDLEKYSRNKQQRKDIFEGD